MIKKILLPVLVISLFSACGDEKAHEKALLDSVITAHDKVMGEDGITIKVRAKLNALAVRKPELKDSANFYIKQLDDNDNKMMDWMNKFNPDMSGKSHEQIMTYLSVQKKEVLSVDSQIKLGEQQAVNFYVRNNKK
jgi:hypothetical protein